jgi:hypothetical protein
MTWSGTGRDRGRCAWCPLTKVTIAKLVFESKSRFPVMDPDLDLDLELDVDLDYPVRDRLSHA